MLVLLHVVIGCGILFRFRVYQNLYSEQRAHPFFVFYFWLYHEKVGLL